MQSILSDCTSILLLGEANFSFSLSLKKLLPPSVSMVTTCYQTEDRIPADDAGVERNIAELRELGARVLFGVDATKLDQTSSLEGALYDAIVFTFPHVGGKGNIGRNRELLKQFFECCRHKLSPNGQVLLTLCNGQGGTPADKPQRKWSDSWQAVAMATWGGFILTQTLPFCAEDYGDYYCTGYRSQSKRFVTQHAITHVFERSTERLDLSHSPQAPMNLHLKLDEETIVADCPPELIHVMDRDLLSKVDHPLALVSADLQRLATESFPDTTIMQSEELPLVLSVENAIISSNQFSPSELYHIHPKEADHILAQDSFNGNTGVPQGDLLGPMVESPEGLPLSPGYVQDYEPRTAYNERVEKDVGIQISEDSPSNAAARQDMEVSVESKENGTVTKQLLSNQFCEDKGTDLTCVMEETQHIKGGTNRQRHLPKNVHSNFVLRPSLLGHIPALLQTIGEKSVIACGRVFRRCNIGQGLYPIKHQCLLLRPASNKSEESWDDFKDHVSKMSTDLLEGKRQISITACHDIPCSPISQQSSLVITMEEPNECSLGTFNIGECGIFHSPEGNCHYCIWNLDIITMVKYDVNDLRLFWSTDERIFAKFDKSVGTSRTSQNLSQIDFKGLSLYPPTYTHDVSFWLKEDTFDELELSSVVRSVTYDLVREVRFLNQYVNQKISYTYRLVYQSCDGALTKKAASSLQLDVREAINKWLGVETR